MTGKAYTLPLADGLAECRSCKGTGQRHGTECANCNGWGFYGTPIYRPALGIVKTRAVVQCVHCGEPGQQDDQDGRIVFDSPGTCTSDDGQRGVE